MLVTSRTYAYQQQDWKLKDFRETVLSHFSEAQIRSFVRHWYLFLTRFRDLTPEEALKQAEELSSNIRSNSRLRELAERPILLTLMTSLHALRGRLPEKRTELYQETVNLLLHRWEWQKSTRPNADGQPVCEYQSLLKWLDVDREKVLGLLGKLACDAHAAENPDRRESVYIDKAKLVMGLWELKKAPQVSAEQIEQHLRYRAGVLLAPDEGIYSFPHRSFQEYLAAYYLTSQEGYPDNIADLLRSDPNHWREVLLLGAAIVAKAGPMIWLLVDALCFREPDDAENTAKDAWGALLAGQALAESANLQQIRPGTQRKLDRVKQ